MIICVFTYMSASIQKKDLEDISVLTDPSGEVGGRMKIPALSVLFLELFPLVVYV